MSSPIFHEWNQAPLARSNDPWSIPGSKAGPEPTDKPWSDFITSAKLAKALKTTENQQPNALQRDILTICLNGKKSLLLSSPSDNGSATAANAVAIQLAQAEHAALFAETSKVQSTAVRNNNNKIATLDAGNHVTRDPTKGIWPTAMIVCATKQQAAETSKQLQALSANGGIELQFMDQYGKTYDPEPYKLIPADGADKNLSMDDKVAKAKLNPKQLVYKPIDILIGTAAPLAHMLDVKVKDGEQFGRLNLGHTELVLWVDGAALGTEDGGLVAPELGKHTNAVRKLILELAKDKHQCQNIVTSSIPLETMVRRHFHTELFGRLSGDATVSLEPNGGQVFGDCGDGWKDFPALAWAFARQSMHLVREAERGEKEQKKGQTPFVVLTASATSIGKGDESAEPLRVVFGGAAVDSTIGTLHFHLHGPLGAFSEELQRRLKKGAGREKYLDVLLPTRADHRRLIAQLEEKFVQLVQLGAQVPYFVTEALIQARQDAEQAKLAKESGTKKKGKDKRKAVPESQAAAGVTDGAEAVQQPTEPEGDDAMHHSTTTQQIHGVGQSTPGQTEKPIDEDLAKTCAFADATIAALKAQLAPTSPSGEVSERGSQEVS